MMHEKYKTIIPKSPLREELDKAQKEYEIAQKQCRFSPTQNNRCMLIKAKTKLDNIKNKIKHASSLWENQI